MKIGHGFTVQGRLNAAGDDDTIAGFLTVLDAAGAVDAAVSASDEYIGVTAYFYARDPEHALALFDEILPSFDFREVL